MSRVTNELPHQMRVLHISQEHQHRNEEEAFGGGGGARQVSQKNELHSALSTQRFFKHYIHSRRKLAKKIFLFFLVRHFRSWCHHLQNSYFTYEDSYIYIHMHDFKTCIKMLCSSAHHKPNPHYIQRKVYTENKDLGLNKSKS